jgi:hypothetical protein
MVNPVRLELDRHHFEIELYGSTYYWEVGFKFKGSQRVYTDTGLCDTPHQCVDEAQAVVARAMREAVTG